MRPALLSIAKVLDFLQPSALGVMPRGGMGLKKQEDLIRGRPESSAMTCDSFYQDEPDLSILQVGECSFVISRALP